MYCDVANMRLASVAFLPCPLALSYLAVFVLYMNRFQIEPEQRALPSLFGTDHAAYKTRVSRWL